MILRCICIEHDAGSSREISLESSGQGAESSHSKKTTCRQLHVSKHGVIAVSALNSLLL